MASSDEVLDKGPQDGHPGGPRGYQVIVACDLVPCKMGISELSEQIHRVLQQAVGSIPPGGAMTSVSSPQCMPVAKLPGQADVQLWLITITVVYYDARTAGKPTDHQAISRGVVGDFLDRAAAVGARVNVEPDGDLSAILQRVAANGGGRQIIGESSAGAAELAMSGRFAGVQRSVRAERDRNVVGPADIAKPNQTAGSEEKSKEVSADGQADSQGQSQQSAGSRTGDVSANSTARYGFPDPRDF